MRHLAAAAGALTATGWRSVEAYTVVPAELSSRTSKRPTVMRNALDRAELRLLADVLRRRARTGAAGRSVLLALPVRVAERVADALAELATEEVERDG